TPAKLGTPGSQRASPTDDFRSISDSHVSRGSTPGPRRRMLRGPRPCPPIITRAALIDVLFVIVPHALLLDIAGPAEAFRLANQHRERRGLPPRFRLRFAAAKALPD